MTQIEDGHAVPVMKLGQTTPSADGPQPWMTNPLARWGVEDVLDTYSLRFPNDMVEVIDGLLQIVVLS